jgi:hypothetical protein
MNYTYDQLKQAVDSKGGLSSIQGTPSPVVAEAAEVAIQVQELPPVEFPMEDLSYTTNIQGSQQDLNLLLSLKDGNGRKQNNFGGSQLILTSDRVVLNSRTDYLMLFGEKGVAISSPNHVNIDADESITIFGDAGLFLGVPGKGTLQGNQKAPKTKGDATVDGNYEPLVLGTKLANLIEDLLVIMKNATMLTPVGKAYFREDVMYELGCLQARIPEILSTYGYIDGISHEKPDPQPKPPTTLAPEETTVTGAVVGSSTAPTTSTPSAPTQQIANELTSNPAFFNTQTIYNDPLE